MYKAIITDFDGTIVRLKSGNSLVDASTVDSIKAILESEKIVACATGREWHLAQKVLNQLNLKHPCIVEGGAKIVDPNTGVVIWEKKIEPGLSNQILNVLKKYSNGGEFLVTSEHPYDRPIKTVDKLSDDLGYVYLIGATLEVADNVCSEIFKLEKAVAHKNPSWQGEDLINIHITNNLADKGHAVNVWREMMDLDVSEIVGLGDSDNDIPLLESVGFGVAVSNASEGLKKVANLIVDNEKNNAFSFVAGEYLLKD